MWTLVLIAPCHETFDLPANVYCYKLVKHGCNIHIVLFFHSALCLSALCCFFESFLPVCDIQVTKAEINLILLTSLHLVSQHVQQSLLGASIK